MNRMKIVGHTYLVFRIPDFATFILDATRVQQNIADIGHRRSRPIDSGPTREELSRSHARMLFHNIFKLSSFSKREVPGWDFLVMVVTRVPKMGAITIDPIFNANIAFIMSKLRAARAVPLKLSESSGILGLWTCDDVAVPVRAFHDTEAETKSMRPVKFVRRP